MTAAAPDLLTMATVVLASVSFVALLFVRTLQGRP